MRCVPWIMLGTGLLLLASCEEKVLTPPDRSCPGKELAGPALDPGHSYIVVAHDRAETWSAVRESPQSPALLEGHGLLGQAPNDLEYREGILYALNSESNSLQWIETATGITQGCVDLGPGTNPWELMLDPHHPDRAWITTFASGELIEVDLENHRVLRRTFVASGLEGLWVTETLIAVTLTGFQGAEGAYGMGTVVVLNKDDLREVRRVAVPQNPQFLVGTIGGALDVVCTGNYGQQEPQVWGQIVRLNASWSAVTDTLFLGGTPGRALSIPNGTVLVAGWFGGLLAYDGTTFTVLRGSANPIEASIGYTDVVLGTQGIYAANFDVDALLLVDPETLTPTGHLLTGDGPSALVAIP